MEQRGFTSAALIMRVLEKAQLPPLLFLGRAMTNVAESRIRMNQYSKRKGVYQSINALLWPKGANFPSYFS
jgi:hypothetical protein